MILIQLHGGNLQIIKMMKRATEANLMESLHFTVCFVCVRSTLTQSSAARHCMNNQQ